MAFLYEGENELFITVISVRIKGWRKRMINWSFNSVRI